MTHKVNNFTLDWMTHKVNNFALDWMTHQVNNFTLDRMTHKISNLTRLNEFVWAVKESGSVAVAVKSFWLEEARLTPIVPMLSCLNRFADWAWKASFLPAWVAVILVIRRTADAKLVIRRVVSEEELAGRVWGWRNIIGGSCHKYHFCRDKCFVATNTTEHVLLSRQIFVATNIIL